MAAKKSALLNSNLEFAFARELIANGGDATAAAKAVLSPKSNLQAGVLGNIWKKKSGVLQVQNAVYITLNFPIWKAEAIAEGLRAVNEDGTPNHVVRAKFVDIANKMDGSYIIRVPKDIQDNNGENPFRLTSSTEFKQLLHDNPIIIDAEDIDEE